MKHAIAGLTIMMSLFLSSCDGGAGGGEDTAPPDTTQGKLSGTAWKLTGWSASSLNPTNFTITATFDDSTIGGTSAVNTYGGKYSSKTDGSFSVADLMMTEMAGPEDAMRAESIYLDLLQQARRYRIKNGSLTLLDASGNELLIFAKR